VRTRRPRLFATRTLMSATVLMQGKQIVLAMMKTWT
jgi:hypothetical protein